MAKVLVKRVPKKTDKNQQRHVINEWNTVIMSKRANGIHNQVFSADTLFKNITTFEVKEK